MDQGAELDALISRMIDDYVSHNQAAKVLRDSLDKAGSVSIRSQTISH